MSGPSRVIAASDIQICTSRGLPSGETVIAPSASSGHAPVGAGMNAGSGPLALEPPAPPAPPDPPPPEDADEDAVVVFGSAESSPPHAGATRNAVTTAKARSEHEVELMRRMLHRPSHRGAGCARTGMGPLGFPSLS